MADGADAVVVLVPVASDDEALRIARTVVEERLAASANVVPGLRSFYRWKGEVRQASEVLVIVKTRRPRVAELIARIEALHSYEVPGILALPVERGLPAYLEWIDASTE
jgi:periplasmic divalent cation tolerance protein